MEKRTSLHGMWSSRLTFVLAVTGSAVGLGNIWKFPYITGANGGGAFVLVYLMCVVAIGLPTMMAEILIGRRGRRNPVKSMKLLGEEEAGLGAWKAVGAIGILAGALILSFYSVIAGWALSYIFKSATGVFTGIDALGTRATFEAHLADWSSLILWHSVFMLMTVFVVARGVQRGLESAVRILMPALVLLLLILLVYSISQGHFAEAVVYLFKPDWSAINYTSVLIALGHSFFTLSIGMGAVMAYGAYLPAKMSIGATAIAVVIADTVIALLAGLVIFPVVFANGLDPAQETGLVFVTLPVAFGNMSGGVIYGTLFFLLLSFAAWTSSIGLIEPAVAYMTEYKRKDDGKVVKSPITRLAAASLLGFGIWLLGLMSVFSFNLLADFTFLRGTLFDNLDFLATNILLPLSGLLIVVFAGWVMCRNSSSEELDIGVGLRYSAWRFLARVVAPAAILFILIKALTDAISG